MPPTAHEDVVNDHRALVRVPPTSSPHFFSIPTAWRGWSPSAEVLESCSRVSESLFLSFGDPTPRFWGTPGFRGSHNLPLPAQADAAPPAPQRGTRRGQQHRRLWHWGRSSSYSAGHAAASWRHPRCLRQQRGAALTCRAPHAPTVGQSPHRTVTRGDTHLGGQRGGRASWGAPGGGSSERSGVFQAPAAPRRWAPPAPASGPCAALW